MTHDFDLLVIGAGSGGVRAANRSAQYGARVAIVEADRVGGTCVLRGCVPKKLMVYASGYRDLLAGAAGYGWSMGEARFDWDTLRDRIQAELTRLNGLYLKGLDGNGVEVLHGTARVTGPNEVTLTEDGRTLTAGKILVAVGGTAVRDLDVDPDGLGLLSDDVFLLERQPERLVVAGGGYIAIEFAHIFARLGTEVTLVYRGDRLLKAFDADLSRRCEADLKAAGVNYIPGQVFERLEGTKKGTKTVTLSGGDTLEADEILWAIGRTPMTDGLGLAETGVELDRLGAVIVDEDSRTSVPSIFAVGDVTNRVNLTPVAIREGAAFASTQFRGEPRRMDYHHIPKAVFAQPPIATVGFSEEEANAAGHQVDVYEADFRAMQNVLADNPTRTFMKLIVDRGTDVVLGCHLVGEDTPEMIQMVAIAVKAGLTKAAFDETCALHPSAAEELVTMATRRDR